MSGKIFPWPEICIYMINKWIGYHPTAKQAGYEDDATNFGEVSTIDNHESSQAEQLTL